MSKRSSAIAMLVVCVLPAAVGAAQARQKKLIEFGADEPLPSFVAQHIREMEKRPFDGVIMRVRNTGYIFENKKWDEAEVAAEFQALEQIKWDKFTDNFILMHAASTMDWFSDADWDNVLHNVGLCAKAASLGRCKGLCFDPEAPVNNPWCYTTQAHAKEKTFEDYQAMARRRGAQFMAKVQEIMPKPVVHTFFLLSPLRGRPAPHDNYALLPAFLNGMLDAAVPGTVITDGNEGSYHYENERQYVDSCRAIHGAADGPLVAAENRAKYRAHVQCAQALYVDHLFNLGDRVDIGAFMSPWERARWFEHNCYWALSTSDCYVWLYSENMNWWLNKNIPPGLEEAVVSAREKLARGQPLGFDVSRMIARARERETKQLNLVRDFNVIGPFNNERWLGHARVYPPEEKIDLSATYEGLTGPARWQQVTLREGQGYLDFTRIMQPKDWTVAYALCYVHSKTRQQAQIRTGTNDSIKLWLNGRLLLDYQAAEGRWAIIDDDITPVTLPAGWSTILVKVAQTTGNWGMYLRISDLKGAPLPGITVAARRP
jgi:hypothetical protein